MQLHASSMTRHRPTLESGAHFNCMYVLTSESLEIYLKWNFMQVFPFIPVLSVG